MTRIFNMAPDLGFFNSVRFLGKAKIPSLEKDLCVHSRYWEGNGLNRWQIELKKCADGRSLGRHDTRKNFDTSAMGIKDFPDR
jgi:hypothetical protein